MKSKAYNYTYKLLKHWYISLRSRKSFWIFPIKLIDYRHLITWMRSVINFKKHGGEITRYWPILTERKSSSGDIQGHYFHQDLLVAQFVFEKSPLRHVDVGSRIDGFVAHCAAFREIEVLDIRDLPDSAHDNIRFKKQDLMGGADLPLADSVSCLHTLEHFGLGRYGDPINPNGHLVGFQNLLSMLKAEGILYISFPIGRKDAVHFNAHRIFHPKSILEWEGHEKLKLIRFDYVDDLGYLHKEHDLMSLVPDVKYGCGIYTFQRI
jgi:hypothetical protein